MAAIREATPALSKGLLSGEGPEEEVLNSSGGAGTHKGPSSPSPPLESTFLRRQTSPQRGQPTDQATKATASRGHGRAIRPVSCRQPILSPLAHGCVRCFLPAPKKLIFFLGAEAPECRRAHYIGHILPLSGGVFGYCARSHAVASRVVFRLLH